MTNPKSYSRAKGPRDRRPHTGRPTKPIAANPASPAAGSHYKLTIEYDGSRYRGWQEQSNAMTVQEVIKNALNEVLANEYQMAGAGRTDAGVHALAQVVSLHTPRAMAHGALLEELNRRLTKDVNILTIEPAAPEFHARHSAVARYYLYQISLRRTAFAKSYCWWVKQALDFGAIDRSLPAFLGLHDYKAFADARMGDGSSKVKVDDLRVTRHGELLLIRIGASHFLWKMVRRIVGVLVKIGTKDVPAGLALSELGRRYAKEIPTWTAPAAGLFLERVCYPGDAPPGEPKPLIAL